MEEFLTALDIGYIKRTVALKVAESLVGKAEQVVAQHGDTIVFTARGPNNQDGTASSFVIGRSDNVNENPLLGTVTTAMRWSAAGGSGPVSLDAQMTTPDGRQSTMRRWLATNGSNGSDGSIPEAEALFVETTVDGVSMRQRFDCVERRQASPSRATAEKMGRPPRPLPVGLRRPLPAGQRRPPPPPPSVVQAAQGELTRSLLHFGLMVLR